MKNQQYLLFVFVLGSVLLSACSTHVIEDNSSKDTNTTLANPASVFCEKQGGTLEIRAAEE